MNKTVMQYMVIKDITDKTLTKYVPMWRTQDNEVWNEFHSVRNTRIFYLYVSQAQVFIDLENRKYNGGA